MIKKFTGVTFTPQEFNQFFQCLRCGIVGHFGGKSICEGCYLLNLKNCEMCDILLWKGRRRFYTYDIREDHREEGHAIKVNKELVREFTYLAESPYPPISETLCTGCLDWESRMKQYCTVCLKPFENSKEYYKFNGNFCPDCKNFYEKSENN